MILSIDREAAKAARESQSPQLKQSNLDIECDLAKANSQLAWPSRPKVEVASWAADEAIMFKSEEGVTPVQKWYLQMSQAQILVGFSKGNDIVTQNSE